MKSSTILSYVWASPITREGVTEDALKSGRARELLIEHDAESDWTIVDRFLSNLGAHDPERTRRLRVAEQPTVSIAGQTVTLTIDVGWLQQYRAVTVISSLSLEDDGTDRHVDDVVAMVWSFGNRQAGSLREATVSAVSAIYEDAARLFDGGATGHCIERRRPDGAVAVPTLELAARNYGLATGDEGWRYISNDTAMTRLGTGWNTRDFVDVRAAGHGVVIQNRKGGAYVRGQSDFVSRYFGGEEPYFGVAPEIAGLDHGIIHALERVTVRRARAESWLANVRAEAEEKGSFALVRTDLDDISELLNSALIAEVDTLEQMLSDRMGLTRLIEKLDRVGNAIDEQTRFNYDKATNRWLLFLTIATVILAAVAVGPIVADWLETLYNATR